MWIFAKRIQKGAQNKFNQFLYVDKLSEKHLLEINFQRLSYQIVHTVMKSVLLTIGHQKLTPGVNLLLLRKS